MATVTTAPLSDDSCNAIGFDCSSDATRRHERRGDEGHNSKLSPNWCCSKRPHTMPAIRYARWKMQQQVIFTSRGWLRDSDRPFQQAAARVLLRKPDHVSFTARHSPWHENVFNGLTTWRDIAEVKTSSMNTNTMSWRNLHCHVQSR